MFLSLNVELMSRYIQGGLTCCQVVYLMMSVTSLNYSSASTAKVGGDKKGTQFLNNNSNC